MAEILTFAPPKSVQPFLHSTKFGSLIVGPVGCLSGDTLILTEFGPIPIADIDRATLLLSWNEKTCQFQLSLCGGAFPKGRDYLYRVTTPEGEFAAAADHRLLCADGIYRRVADLQVGDVLKTCSGDLPRSILAPYLSASPLDEPRYSQTHVDFLEHCAASDRQRGQRFLMEEAADLFFSRGRSGVPRSVWSFAQSASLWIRALPGLLSARSLKSRFAGLFQTGGYLYPCGPLPAAEEGRTAAVFSAHGGGLFPRAQRFLRRYVGRLLGCEGVRSVPDSAFPFLSPSSCSTDRPILAISREEVKRVFWDMQVEETHNYVTVDGAIHHNSTKTTAGIMKISYMASMMAKSVDGVRRSRCIWIRNTNQTLNDTSIPDFLKWFPNGPAGLFEKTNKKFTLRFVSNDGSTVECEVLFRGLDDANDVHRLLSLQASFAVMDEFREIHKDIFEAVQGRLGRYPDGMMVPHQPQWGKDEKGNPIQGCVTDDGQQNKHIWGMSNPPDMETFWEDFMTEPPDNFDVFIQPSGLSKEADWVHLLPSMYYENLMEGKGEEYIDVYIHAKFGRSLSGRPVYRSFNREFHVSKTPLMPILNGIRPIIIGLDFGLNPSAVIGQVDIKGRLLIYSALTSDGMGLVRFLDTILKPHLVNKFPGAPVLVVGDPAGRQRAQTDEKTVYDILKQKNFKAIEASTNSIVARVAAVDTFLNRQIDGGAGMLIDPVDCACLIRGFAGRYRYKRKKDGEMENEPEKNEASHPQDGCQYLCLHADAMQGDRLKNTRRRDVKIARASGWT